MKMTEVRALKDEDLRVQASNLRREIFDTRFKGAVEQIKHPAHLREMRRDIARIETVLHERTRGKAAEAVAAKPAVKAAPKAPKKAAKAEKSAEKAAPKAAEKAKKS
jgi:large subunit ribosomal protein L29